MRSLWAGSIALSLLLSGSAAWSNPQSVPSNSSKSLVLRGEAARSSFSDWELGAYGLWVLAKLASHAHGVSQSQVNRYALAPKGGDSSRWLVGEDDAHWDDVVKSTLLPSTVIPTLDLLDITALGHLGFYLWARAEGASDVCSHIADWDAYLACFINEYEFTGYGALTATYYTMNLANPVAAKAFKGAVDAYYLTSTGIAKMALAQVHKQRTSKTLVPYVNPNKLALPAPAFDSAPLFSVAGAVIPPLSALVVGTSLLSYMPGRVGVAAAIAAKATGTARAYALAVIFGAIGVSYFPAFVSHSAQAVGNAAQYVHQRGIKALAKDGAAAVEKVYMSAYDMGMWVVRKISTVKITVQN